MPLVYRYYRFRCSACGHRYTNRLSPILLGTGRRRCRTCGVVFHDGCKEWPELSAFQKFEYFFPTTVLGFSAAAILIAVVAIFIFRDETKVGLAFGSIVFLVSMLPWVPYFLLQWRHIPKSMARFARRSVLGGDSDEFILLT